MTGVQNDQAHSLENSLLNAVDDLIRDLGVSDVAPPDQYVGFVEAGLGQTMFRFLKRRRGDRKRIIAREALRDAVVNSVRIHSSNRFGTLFVDIFTPDDDANLAHI